MVQVPGAQDPTEIKNILGKTAKLSFHLVDESADVDQVRRVGPKANQILVESKDQEGRYYVIIKQAELTGDMLIDAQATFQNSQAAVSFELSSVGSRIFGEVTKNNTVHNQ